MVYRTWSLPSRAAPHRSRAPRPSSAHALSRRSIYRSSCLRMPAERADTAGIADKRSATVAPLERAGARPVRQVRHRRRLQHAAHVRRVHGAAEGVSASGTWRRRRSASSSAPPTASCSTAAGPSASTSATRSRRCAGRSCRAAAWAINEGLLYLFVHDAHLDKLLAQAFATAVVTVTHLPRQPRVDLPRRTLRSPTVDADACSAEHGQQRQARPGSARRARSARPRARAAARAAS